MTRAKSGDTVIIEYIGRLDDNTVFDTSASRGPVQLTIGEGRAIPAFEKAIVGMEPGDCKTFKVPAEEAYGVHHEELVQTVSRTVLPADLEPEVGQRLRATRLDGRAISVVVTDISEQSITIDANHPLAGKDLIFDVELMTIVESTVPEAE